MLLIWVLVVIHRGNDFAEQIIDTGSGVAGHLFGAFNRIIQRGQHHPPLDTQLIEGAAFDQGLDGTPEQGLATTFALYRGQPVRRLISGYHGHGRARMAGSMRKMT